MDNWLFSKPLPEHVKKDLPEGLFPNTEINFKGIDDQPCIKIRDNQVLTSYFIGTDRIVNEPVYVEPKINEESRETDFLKMLNVALTHSGVKDHIPGLYEIKWQEEPIELNHQKDYLTPLLIAEFLNLVSQVTKKGLKRSFYKVNRNLNQRIKGKVLIGSTIKDNHLKNRLLHTWCSYEEYGVNSLENRLIKKALHFCRRYRNKGDNSLDFIQDQLKRILPYFHHVSDEVQIAEIRQLKPNPFYKEHVKAVRLAQNILRRFGYNITNTEKASQSIKVPPFWIDMSRLFELYVLSLLKDLYPQSGELDYHFTTYGNELDYLINTKNLKMVVDAKYKPKHKENSIHNDVRQVSGYARLKKVHEKLGFNRPALIDCLIIYPDQDEGHACLAETNLNQTPINGYENMFKLGVKLPVQKYY